jgi:hypothetical protein
LHQLGLVLETVDALHQLGLVLETIDALHQLDLVLETRFFAPVGPCL